MINDGTLGGPWTHQPLYYASSSLLPMPPTDGDVARRIVRHGLADILRWLGEDVGPQPYDKVHALQIGDLLVVSRELWADLEGARLTRDVADVLQERWDNPQPQVEPQGWQGPSVDVWWTDDHQ